MGTGSFGGGSGDFTSDADWGDTDSIAERILALQDLTAAINSAPDAATVGPKIYQVLRRRGRSAVIRQNLADDCTTKAFQALLQLSRALRSGSSLIAAFGAAGSVARVRRMTLSDVADKFATLGASSETEETLREICRAATRKVLQRAVGDDSHLFHDLPLASLDAQFDAKALAKFADAFLGTMIFAQIRHDVLALTDAGELTVARISEQIATSWIDRYRSPGGQAGKPPAMDSLLQTIAEDYAHYAGALDE